MNIQRLKFAWARGARIEFNGAGPWLPFRGGIQFFCDDEDNDFRIHPDDAHLEYGPLSTILRDSVLHDTETTWSDAAHELVYSTYADDEIEEAPTVVFDMHKLFVAEYLADQGL